MAIEPRNFIMTEQWAADASTIIPSPPPSGLPYRNPNIVPSVVRSGQFYNSVADSAVWNELIYEATGIAKLASVFGFIPWSPMEPAYYADLSNVMATDGTLWHCIKDCGPGTAAGPIDPLGESGPEHWQTFIDFLGGGAVFPEPYGEEGSALTVIDPINKILGWRMASVPRNQELITTSGIFTAPATGYYRSRKKGGGGGGGGGAAGTLNGNYTSYAGGGGGSGYEVVETVFLEKGQQVQCIIGAAGTAGPGASGQSATAGGDGGDTYFGAGDQKPAKGGKGGGRGTFIPGAGGGGGQGSDGGLKGQNGQVGINLYSYGGVGGAGYVYEDISNGLGGAGSGGRASDSGVGYAGTNGLPGFILIEW